MILLIIGLMIGYTIGSLFSDLGVNRLISVYLRRVPWFNRSTTVIARWINRFTG